MPTQVIDRLELSEPLSPYIGVDPNNYDNDTDYLNAIPGMREKIITGLNTPLSECEPIPEALFNV